MNFDTNSPSTFQGQPHREKSYKWLWIIIVSGLCICIIIAVIIANKFLSQDGPQIEITTGKLDGTIYTNSDESFTCNFENYITTNIWLSDPTEHGIGKVDLYNTLTSVNITIQYFVPSEDIQNLLDNPPSYGEGISRLAENIGNEFMTRFPNSDLLISENRNNGNIFIVYNIPDARYSYFDNPTSDLDLLLGILIFAKSHYAYILQNGFPLNIELQALSQDNQIGFIRKSLEEISRICTFNK